MRLAIALVLALGFAAVSCGAGAPQYRVTVSFNESVTQEDIDETGDVLRSYDSDLEYLIQESFPPVGVATVETDVPNFCRTIEAELAGRSYVRDVSCERASSRSSVGVPDDPVSSD